MVLFDLGGDKEKEIEVQLSAWLGGTWKFWCNKRNLFTNLPAYEADLKNHDVVVIPKAFDVMDKEIESFALYLREKKQRCSFCHSDKLITGIRSDCGNPILFCDECKKVL